MARRKGGLFLPLDVSFMDDDKIEDAGEAAGWLYLAMALKCKALRSDGVLTRRQIDKLQVKGWQRRLVRCVEVGLAMELADDRYWLPAWGKHNDSAEVVQDRLLRDAERKRERRNRSGVGSDAVGTPSRLGEESVRVVEKSREENAESGSVSAPDDCEHGHAGKICIDCVKASKAGVA